MKTKEQRDELRKLAGAATRGPWMSMRDGNQYIETSYLPTAKGVGASHIPELVRPWNPHAYVSFGFKPSEFETARFRDADADYIAAANPVTVLALLDRIEDLEPIAHCSNCERTFTRKQYHHFQEYQCTSCGGLVKTVKETM